MYSFAHVLDKTIQPLQPFIIGIALIIWAIAFVNQIRDIRAQPFFSPPRTISRTFFVCALLFGGIIASEFAVGAFINAAALDEIRPILLGELEAITINGKPATQGNALFAALGAMHDTMGHHSHPTDRFNLHLKTSRGSIRMVLARDSGDPHEYWAFYPQFYSTQSNAVGHVFTNALDGI